jgi:hypothetical protein
MLLKQAQLERLIHQNRAANSPLSNIHLALGKLQELLMKSVSISHIRFTNAAQAHSA